MSKKIKIADKFIGGGSEILIQSMCNTRTYDVNAVTEQILGLERAGCDIVRVAVPDEKSAVFTTYSAKGTDTQEILGLAPFLVLDEQNNPYGTLYMEKGTKIAQVVFNEVIHAEFIETDDVSLIGKNRGGGYGSTGLK